VNVTVLDGGLATELEAQGADLSDALWSARVLADDPSRVVAAHRAFVAAGADVAITGSYQASFGGYARAGVEHDRAAELMWRSVSLARSAGARIVAASVGPYGATLADGSEYTGRYGLTVAQLREFHRERLHVLASAGPDLLAVETIPSLPEVEAICAELSSVDVPAWVSMTTTGTATAAGEPLAEAFAIADSCPAVIAVGVNCVPPAVVAQALRVAASVTAKPLVAYPNSGERWDAAGRTWTGEPAISTDLVRSWLELGARYVGGCCRVGPVQISRIAHAAREWDNRAS
jgi:S-methylmethionine-dependent homocysteine/selenocysteine methylase